jgi:leader peptidase (prepilin peptidase)/N-methyltransferase
MLNTEHFLRLLYHLILVTLLVVATFIDYDYLVIPDEVTVTGMVLGLGLGALMPQARPEPAFATTFLGGLAAGLIGWAVGGGLVWSVRIVAGAVLRREAMGFGDVTLLAMIGSFLGWQAVVVAFFIAPFFGLVHALWKVLKLVGKMIGGLKISGADREMPLGPYLSLASLVLLLGWPWIWNGWAKAMFSALGTIILWMLGRESSPGPALPGER